MGPVGLRVADNLARLREQRGLSLTQLARRLAAAGRPIPVLGLRRLEELKRRVDVDDLVAFAAVFDVPAERLLSEKLSLTWTIEGEVEWIFSGRRRVVRRRLPPPPDRRCVSMRYKDGKQCRLWARLNKETCWQHGVQCYETGITRARLAAKAARDD